MTTARKALDNLAEFLIEDIMSMSDEEILAECREDGDDIEEIAARMRTIFDSAVELAARRAVVAAANAHQGSITITSTGTITTSTGTTTATACKRCGQLIYQGISHMCPDFDEPMEFVDSKRLRALEALEATHQATCPTCGAPLPGGVPAKDALVTGDGSGTALPPFDATVERTAPPAPDANIANEPKPSGYMSRPKML